MTDDLDPKVALAEQFAECKRRRERDRERIAEVEAESALKLVAGVSAPGPVGVVLLGAGEQHRQQEAGGAGDDGIEYVPVDEHGEELVEALKRAEQAEAKAAELERMLLIHWQHQHNLVYDTDPSDGTSYDDWLADLRERSEQKDRP